MKNSEIKERLSKINFELLDYKPLSSYEPYFGWCDVEGCDNEGCSGGNAWREYGYWTVCSMHSSQNRHGKNMPKMKKEAIEREKLRDRDGYLPSPSPSLCGAMTSKQKADELIEKFSSAVLFPSTPNETADEIIHYIKVSVRKCALICVEEIIEAGSGDVIIGEGEDADLVSGFTFYSAVKSELEKL